jgi:hypothetical protein
LSHWRSGASTTEFRKPKHADFPETDARNRRLGLAGEFLVIEYEDQRLRSEGRPDLAERIRHVSAIQGDGAGYDISSLNSDGTERQVEVKTTRGSETTPFLMSSNESAFSRQHPQDYCLYRMYDYDEVGNCARFYVVKGDVERWFMMVTTQDRMIPAPESSRAVSVEKNTPS